MSKSQHLLSGNSKMLTFTKGEESTVASCVSVCQQVLVIMTYLHCLLWLFPKEARGAPLQEGGVAECFRDQELNKSSGTCQGFYIFIESEVLPSCLRCPRGQVTVTSLHLVSPCVCALLLCTSAEKQSHISSLLF